ncbi:MAG: hypothetical protein D6748_10715 [Calditrichaeota bacterium]|nr:MAG: hypothetical protein D6748_10715 [Calditrichota bacterium]
MRIKELQLETHLLKELKHFYNVLLGFQLLREKKDAFTVKIGHSHLTFLTAQEGEEPFYHFAFNIPENQIIEAAGWVSQKIPLITVNEEEIFVFPSWNAHSIYFFDPAGNIVEFIARHNLKNASRKKFSAKSVLNISEIGIPTDNVKLFVNQLQQELSLPVWYGHEGDLIALGDEEGLLIIVPLGRKWFPTDKPAENYPVSVVPG